jgi:acetoin utilization deacetylase AcuC-like enzyme/predicted N-acetyltransferase YhbS
MIRVRRITEPSSNEATIAECQAMIRAQFPGMPAADIDKLPLLLADPLKYQLVATLLVAEDHNGKIKGCAVLLHAPDLKFTFLDTMTAAPGRTGGGLGGLLYQAVRDEARARKATGLYFECLPDDAALCPNPEHRRQNAARLRFYERFGARPIRGTAYETPVIAGTVGSPFLVFDALGRRDLPRAARVKAVIRAILERKYAQYCPPDYTEKVVASVRDSTLHLRPPRYQAKAARGELPARAPPFKIPLVFSQQHQIHHVRERGYVEAPVRISAILAELGKTELFETVAPKRFPDKWIRDVHEAGLVDYIQRACAEAPVNKSVYPYVFPLRNPERKPKDRSVLAGYWCIDTFTPLNRNAYPAARAAADCALTAAERVKAGAPIAYALVRPPGHHAERRAFGGFCYLNNAAIAAQFLSGEARVAVLDVDYHHGNGTQDIFYERPDVLTVSIHGHPSIAYPYFTGFAGERGRGRGQGFNLNLPLQERASPDDHRAALSTALRRIARHQADYLVVALGLDTARGDPTGSWALSAPDFRAMGRMIGEAGLPTLIVQEGGYLTRTLGTNARHFFLGLMDGHVARPRKIAVSAPASRIKAPTTRLRDHVQAADASRVRRVVAATGFFTEAEIEIAVELVEERVRRGRASGYEFTVLERAGELLAYACYGPTPGTDITYDLYWIVVAPEYQGGGFGRRILERVEARIVRSGGRQIYVETSSTARYAPTRGFYLKAGFREAARLADFYRAGDSKVIYEKRLGD